MKSTHFISACSLLVLLVITTTCHAQPKLVGHWPLTSNASDITNGQRHGTAENVTFDAKSGATFNGLNSRISIGARTDSERQVEVWLATVWVHSVWCISCLSDVTLWAVSMSECQNLSQLSESQLSQLSAVRIQLSDVSILFSFRGPHPQFPFFLFFFFYFSPLTLFSDFFLTAMFDRKSITFETPKIIKNQKNLKKSASKRTHDQILQKSRIQKGPNLENRWCLHTFSCFLKSPGLSKRSQNESQNGAFGHPKA